MRPGKQLTTRAYGGSATATGSDHEERSVQERAQECRVGDRLKGRAVEDDKLVLGLETVKDHAHPLGAEEFYRIRRQGAGREDPKVGLLGFLDHVVEADPVAPKEGCETVRVVCVEHAVDTGLPQVCVDQGDPAASLGKGHSEVGGRRGLALARQ